jgi:hypothetical protein
LPGVDSALCERLIPLALAQDEAAWQALIGHLWTELHGLVRTHRTMASLGRSDDDVHDVLTQLVERLRRNGGRGLQLYAAWHARNPHKTFADWIHIVTVNVIRSYVRGQLAPAPGDAPLVSVKRFLNEFAQSPMLEDLGVRPPITDAQTAQELLTFARTRLPEAQCRALMMWIEDEPFPEIARRMKLATAKEAEQLVRAAAAVLRRHFGGRAGPEG